MKTEGWKTKTAAREHYLAESHFSHLRHTKFRLDLDSYSKRLKTLLGLAVYK